MKRKILQLVDGNGDVMWTYSVQENCSREEEFRKRLQAIGLDLVPYHAGGNESQLAQRVALLEKEAEEQGGTFDSCGQNI